MNITPLTRTLIAGALLVSLSGCGYLFGDQGVFRDKSEDYKKAPDMPVITVPETKDSEALQEIYPVPPVANALLASEEFEVPRPTPLSAGAEDEIVRIQSLGEESWILVAEAPGQVWPQVRSFFASAGIPVPRVDARAGTMETGWLALESATMASRFRVRIEQGVQRGNSELHVLQQNQAGDINAWPDSSDNAEQEAEMLKALAQFIANSAGTAPVSMVAEQAISASGKISLQETAGGEPFILLTLPFDRAWASLGRGLEKSTFDITDRDRSSGVYYATFSGPQAEDDDGWFDWLWGGDDDHPQAGQPFIVSVTAEDENNVAIFLRHAGEATSPLEKREKQALLTMIKGNID
ncbi:outer membrane protein assembly factor BamC [Seongchinamella sediminis]|uniref:Outer membrane protein assembly factor BamC n=1 Tax=Seongchinamella sediminis TaxID=2283635 RepID=A0A3L7DX97_9GAMM|nr:outer membrane protein assembly factor BamC [Seongchinamella sediminis]RLQ21944.1 outer membrane protein assembly factor BamC [Seongchinamella sediminis]